MIDVFLGLRALLINILPNIPSSNILQGQQNRTPMPKGDCVIMTETLRSGLATTERTYSDKRETKRSTRVVAQIDFYGTSACDNAQTFNTLFQDLYGADFLKDYGVQPLYCDDGHQMPLIDSSEQYVQRWTISASFQINPVVSTNQDFTDNIDITTTKVQQ